MKPVLPLLAVLFAATVLHADEPGFKVPPGFRVELYAPDSLATDIFSLTIDAKGRVVVAGKGYVKALEEGPSGKAERAVLLSTVPKTGAHGMYFDGDDLICNGDGGVRRFPGSAKVHEQVPPAYFATKNDGEHAANAILKGPDGWFTMIAGNDAGMKDDFVSSPTSPIKTPMAGMLVRFSPDGKTREIVADGFRNPYGLSIGPRGDILTVDSDGERIYHLPYYTPTRVFDVAYGMHHGWVNAGWQSSWAPPEWWPDVVDRVCNIGRGSPTACVVYRHRAFPEKYRGGLFSLCWTFGKLYFFPLTPEGSTYRSKTEVFLETTGDVGFAPTGMAVGPKGDLFIAIGGRGTRGSVFRVWYDGPEKTPELPTDPVRAVLAADEPLASWSRARWVPAAKKLGEKAFVDAMRDGKLPIDERIRAIEILTELYGGVRPEQVKDLDSTPDVKARVVWSLTRFQKTDATLAAVVDLTKGSQHPRVLRAVWEAFAFWPDESIKIDQQRWIDGVNSTDRRVRSLMREVVTSNRAKPNRSNPQADALRALAETGRKDRNFHFAEVLDTVGKCLRASNDPEERTFLILEYLRFLQKDLGDVMFDGKDKVSIGYAPRVPTTHNFGAQAGLARSFPPLADPRLAAELARTCAMAKSSDSFLVDWVSKHLERESSSLEDDEHLLLCLAQMRSAKRAEATSRIAAALIGLPEKYEKAGAKPSDQVPAVLDAMTGLLLENHKGLEAALLEHPRFGKPGHEFLALRFTKDGRLAATKKLVQGNTEWSPELVGLVVGNLESQEAVRLLEPLVSETRLSDPILLFLAEKGSRRTDFVRALGSSQAKVVEAGAARLVGSAKPADAELVAAIKAIRRFSDPKTDKSVRASLEKLLGSWTRQKIDDPDPAKANAAWADWFVKSHAGGDKLLGMSGASTEKWLLRIATLDFSGGDAERGFAVFQKRNCYRCHGDKRRLGPDLAGAAQRFSIADLFTAIVEPSKDIAPSFESKVIVTNSGKTYSGMLIYDSQELILLQVSPDTTVRIPGSDVQSIGRSTISFMPTGLIDDADDRELVDLYAYLRSLRK